MASRFWWLLLLLLLVVALAAYGFWPADERPVLQAGWVSTVGVLAEDEFVEPWGIAAGPDGLIYVADGAGGNRIRAVSTRGQVATLAGSVRGFADGHAGAARFHTPSGLAIDGDGTLYVADTGNNAIRRITREGEVSTLARRLNGPMGVAVDAGGRVLAADTYNDRIVAIDDSGHLTPIASDAGLDTPTALAVDRAGTIYVADTGNNLVRVIDSAGNVTELDASAVGGLQRPLGITIDGAGTLYVTDESARVVEFRVSAGAAAARVIAGSSPGFQNGPGPEAQFRQPGGLVALEPGRLVVGDSGNGLVRTVTALALADATPPSSPWLAPRFDVDAFQWQPLLWPLEPMDGPFEVAGTLGEARGEDAARFHAGIDVRADQGAPVLAVRDGIVRAPLANGDFGSLNEWLRVDEITYVHMRVGRTIGGASIDDTRFAATRDERGRITRIRAKRGAHFSTGDIVGSVNPFNHVHLNVGWGGEEYNPLLFRLVQFADRVPPTIARGGVRLYDAQGTLLVTRAKGRLLVSGPVQIVVDAWDQADGNRPNRRLGIYSLGYQVLHADGTPAPGYGTPLETIRFDRLVAHPDATRLVYAAGSGIPYYGQRRTRFLYIVTNTFRDGLAAPGTWDTSQLAPGDYVLRLRVADISGNEARQHRDVLVTVTGRDPPAGG